MCGIFNRIKVVKDLILQKLDENTAKLGSLEKINQGVSHLVENQLFILNSLSHLIRLSSDFKNLTPILNDLKQQIENSTEKLGSLEGINQGVGHLVENQSFILNSLSHLIRLSSNVPDTYKDAREIKSLLVELSDYLNNLNKTNDNETLENIYKKLTKDPLEEISHKLSEQDILTRALKQNLEESLDAILCKLKENTNVSIRLNSEDSRNAVIDPEIQLMSFLYSFLPSRIAIDVGANIGTVSEILLESGYEVYAFEPYLPTFAMLTSKLSNHPNFHSFDFAVGSHDGEMDLYVVENTSGNDLYKQPSLYNTVYPHSMPPGLEFTNKISVGIRSIKSLQEKGEIPDDIGLLKIDAEGYDLEIIRGCTDISIPVVVSEFWDENHVFADFDKFNPLKIVVEQMKSKEYYWYIVISHKNARVLNNEFIYDIFYYCNSSATLGNSWGNVFFFNQYEIFEKAMNWCSAKMTQVYF